MKISILLVGLSLLLLAGCLEEQVDPELDSAARDYFNSVWEGDPDTAWSMVSNRCRRTISEDYFRGMVEFEGTVLDDLRIVELSTDVDDHNATVELELNIPDEFEPERAYTFVRSALGWRWDDCPENDPSPRDLW